MVFFHFLILILISFSAFSKNSSVTELEETKIIEEEIKQANNTEQSENMRKNDDINEFKKKLFNEEELRKGTDNVVEDDDFDVFLEDEQEEEEKPSKKTKNEVENKEKKQVEVKKKDEPDDSNKQTEVKQTNKDIEKKSNKNEIVNTENRDSEVPNIEDKNPNKNPTGEDYDDIKQDIYNDIYNITDTGVSEEFLFSKEYKNLINNKTTIKKDGANSESDIPILYVVEKNLIDFNTSDIPEEIMAYKRSEENKHIPTIITTSDIQNIAKKAIITNDLAILRSIVEQTQNPDFMIDTNRTAFAFCVENSRYTLVRYMIYSGASINMRDYEGNTLLHIAIKNKDFKMIQLLLNNGADINIGNNVGDTPLLYSLKYSDDKISIFLLKFGADINVKNIDDETAYSLCIKYGKKRIQQYIADIKRLEN